MGYDHFKLKTKDRISINRTVFASDHFKNRRNTSTSSSVLLSKLNRSSVKPHASPNKTESSPFNIRSLRQAIQEINYDPKNLFVIDPEVELLKKNGIDEEYDYVEYTKENSTDYYAIENYIWKSN